LSGECESYSLEFNDTEVNSFGGKLYVLSQSEFGDDKSIRMRRFSSIKQVVSLSKHGLQTFECFKDGFKNAICDQSLKLHKINALWKLDSEDNKGKILIVFLIMKLLSSLFLSHIYFSDFYTIQLNGENSFIGVSSFRNNSIDSNAFVLYNNVGDPNKFDDKILFSFELTNYTFNAQLHSIEWDQSLDDIISANKKQISLIETAIINNNSPANLNHEVSEAKSFTESFSTSFGKSTRFLESFSLREDHSTSDTQSK
jgi:hypothetical protein